MARRRGRVAFAAALALFLVTASVSIERSDALFEDQAGKAWVGGWFALPRGRSLSLVFTMLILPARSSLPVCRCKTGEHDWVKALAGGLLRQVLIVRDAPKHAFVSTGNGLHGGSLGGNGAAPPPATVASVNTRTGLPWIEGGENVGWGTLLHPCSDRNTPLNPPSPPPFFQPVARQHQVAPGPPRLGGGTGAPRRRRRQADRGGVGRRPSRPRLLPRQGRHDVDRADHRPDSRFARRVGFFLRIVAG